MSAAWPKGWMGFAARLAPPLAALVLAEALLWTIAFARGSDPRLGPTWVRWDSYRYVEIARGGYVEVAEDPNSSNTGWFPGFPMVMRLGERRAADDAGARGPLGLAPLRARHAHARLDAAPARGVVSCIAAWRSCAPPSSPAGSTGTPSFRCR